MAKFAEILVIFTFFGAGITSKGTNSLLCTVYVEMEFEE
jgi:hypothetical protein